MVQAVVNPIASLVQAFLDAVAACIQAVVYPITTPVKLVDPVLPVVDIVSPYHFTDQRNCDECGANLEGVPYVPCIHLFLRVFRIRAFPIR